MSTCAMAAASLVPSPTNATRRPPAMPLSLPPPPPPDGAAPCDWVCVDGRACPWRWATRRCLSAGDACAVTRTRGMPTAAATATAVACASPVHIRQTMPRACVDKVQKRYDAK